MPRPNPEAAWQLGKVWRFGSLCSPCPLDTDSITVDFAGATLCPCTHSSFYNLYVLFDGTLDRTITATTVGAGLWRGSQGTIDLHYGSTDCTFGVSHTPSYFTEIHCDGTSWRITGRCDAGMFFDATGTPPFPAPGTIIANQIIAACGGSAFPVPIAHGGTATII